MARGHVISNEFVLPCVVWCCNDTDEGLVLALDGVWQPAMAIGQNAHYPLSTLESASTHQP